MSNTTVPVVMSETDMLSMDYMMTNLRVLHGNASPDQIFDGTHWYDAARQYAAYLAVRHDVSETVAAAVIAAHSMNARWQENMRRAEAHLAGNPYGLPNAIAMADKAIVAGKQSLWTPDDVLDCITGPKLNPFARCVAGDLTAVATDRWAQRAAFNSLDDKLVSKLTNRKGVRDRMIAAYTVAAEEVGVQPAILQAIVWVVIRGSAD